MNRLKDTVLEALDPLVGHPRRTRRELASLHHQQAALTAAYASLDSSHKTLNDAHVTLTKAHTSLHELHADLGVKHASLGESHQQLGVGYKNLGDSHTQLAAAHALQKAAFDSLLKQRGQVIDQYLTLLESCLTGSIYDDPPLQATGLKEFDARLREYGWDWPSVAHTMIGRKRLANVRSLVESILGNNIPGDLIETGVWRGGACILMRAVLSAYGVKDRKVWLADSFEGLPLPDSVKYPDDTGDTFHTYQDLSVSVEQVKANFEKYKLLDEQVGFIKGWFEDTLPTAPIQQLALLRLDGDMYGSTIVALDSLYDKLSNGGYVIVDDYHVVEGCKRAIHDFFDKRNIAPSIEEIDGVGIFWKKLKP